MTPILTEAFAPPACDIKEILRYAGAWGEAPEVEALVKECLRELNGKLTYRVCYRDFPITRQDGVLDLGFVKTDSAAVSKHLAGCDRAIVFAATLGIGIDRLISRYAAASPTKSLLFQAIGAERIEGLCDVFERSLQRKQSFAGRLLRPRFSPGYGDFPLAVQKDIFSVLDCPRKIGLSLNESLLMSPSKSVTALIGVGLENAEQ